MPHTITWVKQEDSCGCGIAALAMLTGQTYQAVAQEFQQPLENGYIYDLSQASPPMQIIDRYLAERGYAVCRLFARDLFQPRSWPPEPFAPLHLCHVKATETSEYLHWVVMAGNGEVFDPEQPERTRLSDYYRVYDVAAVIPLPAHP